MSYTDNKLHQPVTSTAYPLVCALVHPLVHPPPAEALPLGSTRLRSSCRRDHRPESHTTRAGHDITDRHTLITGAMAPCCLKGREEESISQREQLLRRSGLKRLRIRPQWPNRDVGYFRFQCGSSRIALKPTGDDLSDVSFPASRLMTGDRCG